MKNGNEVKNERKRDWRRCESMDLIPCRDRRDLMRFWRCLQRLGMLQLDSSIHRERVLEKRLLPENENVWGRKREMLPFWVRTSWPDCRSPEMSGVWLTSAIAKCMCVSRAFHWLTLIVYSLRIKGFVFHLTYLTSFLYVFYFYASFSLPFYFISFHCKMILIHIHNHMAIVFKKKKIYCK